jgi:hypothetical protein
MATRSKNHRLRLGGHAGTTAGGARPTFQYDPVNSRHNPDASGPKVAPETHWHLQAGSNESGPVVLDSVVYVGPYDDRFHAIDLADDSGLWTKGVGNDDPPVAVAGRTVFAVAGSGVFAFEWHELGGR